MYSTPLSFISILKLDDKERVGYFKWIENQYSNSEETEDKMTLLWNRCIKKSIEDAGLTTTK